MTLDDTLIAPFTHFAFLRRALVACIVLSVSGAPLGFFMNQRRMALVSDAMSHAILPGVAVAFLVAGAGVLSLTIGGLIAGVVMALAAVALSRYAHLREDAVFTLLFLLSLTSGIVLLSLKGSNLDLLRLLFGDVLAMDDASLIFMTGVAVVTLHTLALIYRGLILDGFDPDFLRASGRGRGTRLLFFAVFMINLVAAFQALGTLMALGLMLLPSLAAGFWTRRVNVALPLGILIAVGSSIAGLLISFHANTPAGPTVVLVCGSMCLASALVGPEGSARIGLRRGGA